MTEQATAAAAEQEQNAGAAATQQAASSSQEGAKPNSVTKPNGGAVANETVAAGGEGAAGKENAQAKPYWPEDWRQKWAEHVAAGDQKALKREQKRLERITDPASLYGMYRELEAKFDRGGLVRVPGDKAKPEEVAEWNKAIGVPEKPEGYLESVKLSNGAVLGDNDKPVATAFAKVMHEAGAPPQVFNKALDWYFQHQEALAAQQDEADEAFKNESRQALKEEFGPAFNRNMNATKALFTGAPGGADPKNPESLYSRMLTARTWDGRKLGDDPSFLKWLTSMAMEINPAATVTDAADASGKSMDDEIAAIEKRMREDRRGYFKDTAAQARYRDLLAAREKHVARRSAA